MVDLNKKNISQELYNSLFQHQKDILNDDKKKCGLWLGTGGSKTLTSLLLAEGKTLVIAPKQQILDKNFEETLTKFSLNRDITVISKDQFKIRYTKKGASDIGTDYKTIIVDEAHYFFGVYTKTKVNKETGDEIPDTSGFFKSLYRYLKEVDYERLYLCTATPKSKPLNVFAIYKILGKEIMRYTNFRNMFYTRIMRGRTPIYIPKKSKANDEYLIQLLKNVGYTGRLEDWFDVPEQTHRVINVELTKQQKDRIEWLKKNTPDQNTLSAKIRSVENGVEYNVTELVDKGNNVYEMEQQTAEYDSNKIDYIYELYEEFGKVLVFAQYTAQILSIKKALQKKGVSDILIMSGQYKEKTEESVPITAEKKERCIVIAQASISAGYELPSFSCVVFASKSTKFIDYEQGLGRVLRANAIKKNLYVHLVVKGGYDEKCHNTIMEGKDFQEKLYE